MARMRKEDKTTVSRECLARSSSSGVERGIAGPKVTGSIPVCSFFYLFTVCVERVFILNLCDYWQLFWLLIPVYSASIRMQTLHYIIYCLLNQV